MKENEELTKEANDKESPKIRVEKSKGQKWKSRVRAVGRALRTKNTSCQDHQAEPICLRSRKSTAAVRSQKLNVKEVSQRESGRFTKRNTTGRVVRNVEFSRCKIED